MRRSLFIILPQMLYRYATPAAHKHLHTNNIHVKIEMQKVI